jgi:hypothetical protein
MGRPLGPSGGRCPGGGGTGLPEGLKGGRARRWSGGAAVSGAWAAGECAAAGAWAGEVEGRSPAGGAAGGRSVGRLLISRDERTGASAPAPAPAPAPVAAAPSGPPADAAAGAGTSAGGAATVRAGAFLAGAMVAPALDAATAFRGAGASAGALAAAPSAAAGTGAASAVVAAFLAGAAFLVDLAAFLAGAGSSGWTGRRNPSASALRRTRSACASSMEDEWLLTPIPRERASSSPSLLVRPSSLASS